MKNKSQKERLEELSNALFGSPEDLSLEHALETLKLAEISPEELCDRTYNELLLKARAYRTRQQEVPPRLKKALEDLRPATAPARSQEELDRSASATVSRVIDAVRGFKLPSSSPSFALSTSYRNKKSEKSPKDQRTIDRLEKELLHDLGEEEKDDQD
jgi:hypothetical protein